MDVLSEGVTMVLIVSLKYLNDFFLEGQLHKFVCGALGKIFGAPDWPFRPLSLLGGHFDTLRSSLRLPGARRGRSGRMGNRPRRPAASVCFPPSPVAAPPPSRWTRAAALAGEEPKLQSHTGKPKHRDREPVLYLNRTLCVCVKQQQRRSGLTCGVAEPGGQLRRDLQRPHVLSTEQNRGPIMNLYIGSGDTKVHTNSGDYFNNRRWIRSSITTTSTTSWLREP